MSSPVEEIKKRVNIVDLIGSYIRLSKAGANFKAVCPFHNEKTPSFYVSPAREIFHCFGCNAGGDAFRFVMMIEGIEFPEALEMLAGRAGVVLKREDPRLSSERKKLLNLIEDATKYFESELAKNTVVKEYLRTRGLKEETMSVFRLGFVPDGWENLLGYLSQRGYKTEEIAKAGLALQSSNPNSSAKFYDRFRSRIMFPISDSSGRVVGFSGRIFNKETNEGKYINTPNTALYDKSRILYLWDRAKNEVRKENICHLVEGQMDALMSHQAGVKNVVATSGTAVGKEHIKAIKRLADKICFVFDSDDPGMISSNRAIEIAFEEGMDVHSILLDKKDPADLILENVNEWREAVKDPLYHIQFLLKSMKKRHGTDWQSLMKEAQNNVLRYIKAIHNEIIRDRWGQEVASALGVSQKAIIDEINKLPRDRNAAKVETKLAPAAIKSRRHLVEERILGMMKWKASLLPGREENLKDLFSEENSPMLESVLAGNSNFETELSKLALEAELLYGDAEKMEEEMAGLVSELGREVVKSKLESLSEEIRKTEAAGEREKLAQYLKDFQDESRKLNYLWQEAKLRK